MPMVTHRPHPVMHPNSNDTNKRIEDLATSILEDEKKDSALTYLLVHYNWTLFILGSILIFFVAFYSNLYGILLLVVLWGAFISEFNSDYHRKEKERRKITNHEY